jgi:hypothetical protein
MMLIFRRDFTEVIEIGTSLRARHRPDTPTGPGTFHSYAHVHCIVRSVTNAEHDGLKFLRALKNTSSCREDYFALAELLGQIAERLPPRRRQEEEDDDGNTSEEDAQMRLIPMLAQMQINHQPHAAPAPQQMPPPPQVQVNHQPHVAPVQPQMPGN